MNTYIIPKCIHRHTGTSNAQWKKIQLISLNINHTQHSRAPSQRVHAHTNNLVHMQIVRSIIDKCTMEDTIQLFIQRHPHNSHAHAHASANAHAAPKIIYFFSYSSGDGNFHWMAFSPSMPNFVHLYRYVVCKALATAEIPPPGHPSANANTQALA